MAKVAFLGLGVMGYPMAGHLKAKGGHDVTVYNRTYAKAEAWAKQHGGHAAKTPREAAKDCDFVFACVGNDDDLRSVVLGPDGAFAGMKKGAIFVDNTTASAEVKLPPILSDHMVLQQAVKLPVWGKADPDEEITVGIAQGQAGAAVQVKADKDGNWLMSWGSPGAEPGQFNTLHSIAIDAKDNVYVADRGNRRIQVFDTSGKLLRVITIDVPVPADARAAIGNKPPATFAPGSNQAMAPGSPWAICITPRPNQVLYAADAFPGRIYKLSLDGKVLGWLGQSGKQLKQFGWIHELACPSENEIYAAELLNWRAQKLMLHPK